MMEPTKEHPLPYDESDETAGSYLEELAVAGKTAELKEALGAPIEVSEADITKEQELLEAVVKARNPAGLKKQSTALAASAFLKTYGQKLAMDAGQARAAITNKLMEIANCGDTKYELKALELLGKHSDIGIFTERSEVTVKYQNPEELENAIKERVKRLLNADVIDVTPLSASLDEELGLDEITLSDEAEELFEEDGGADDEVDEEQNSDESAEDVEAAS